VRRFWDSKSAKVRSDDFGVGVPCRHTAHVRVVLGNLALAAELDARGIPTPTGSNWTAAGVQRALKRLTVPAA
jgi:hypothetical protein